jgi:hypothetical protein
MPRPRSAIPTGSGTATAEAETFPDTVAPKLLMVEPIIEMRGRTLERLKEAADGGAS